MGAAWLIGLILFVAGPVGAWLLVAGGNRKPSPRPPLRLVRGGHVRVWPAWWDELDQWRDEA